MPDTIRHIEVAMAPKAMARLVRLRTATDASGFAEVIRAALREYEHQIASKAEARNA